MAENAYLTRLNQLREQKVESAEKRMAPLIGRPLTRQAPGPAKDPRGTQPEEPQGPDMSTMFGRNLESFMGEDNRFGEMFQEFTKLAEGLRQEVEQGYMPMPIAQQRLQSYLNDSQGYFSKNKAGPMNNPQLRGAMESMLEQGMSGEQMPPQDPTQQMPPEGGM